MRASWQVAGWTGAAFAVLLVLVVLEWGPLLRADERLVEPVTDFTRAHDTYRAAMSGITYAMNSQLMLAYIGVIAAATAVGGRLRSPRGPREAPGWGAPDSVGSSRVVSSRVASSGRKTPGGVASSQETRSAPGRRCGPFLWLVLVVGLGTAVNPLVKSLVGRERPTVSPPVDTFTGLSFPSGHASSATFACAALLVVVWSRLSAPGRAAGVVLALALPILSAWTRLAVGGHYVSDLAGGFLLGIAWVAAWVPLLRAAR